VTDFYQQLPRKRIGAGALITDEDGRVLMVEPTYKEHWEIPGGVVERGETAFDACCTRSHRFVELPRLAAVTVARLVRRIHFALQARHEGRTIELADGHPTAT
jgi:ADP-ribose pyrophosphatase YjhB (NUDIX family)